MCREFAGRDNQVHHIVPEADGGPDSIDNAISLCSKCHTEASHYNPRQPMGTKYSPDELRRFRDELWQLAEEHRVGQLIRGSVGVSPSKIEISLINLEASHALKIFNSTPRAIADVQISLTVCSGALRAADLRISPDDSDDIETLATGAVEIDLGTVGVCGTDDFGREALLIDMRNIAPMSERSIGIICPRVDEPTVLAVMLDGYHPETEPILRGDEILYRPFAVYRGSFTVKTMKFFINSNPEGLVIGADLFTKSADGRSMIPIKKNRGRV